jgi:hypothetical protein
MTLSLRLFLFYEILFKLSITKAASGIAVGSNKNILEMRSKMASASE